MAREKKMVVLKSSDGEKFEVEEAVAMKSELIKKIIEEGYDDDHILLDNVTGNILTMVIQFCKRHVDSTTPDDNELKVFDTKFVQVDHPTLSNIILAANYLNIKSLLDLTCKTVLDMIKGETPEVIVKTFENYSPGGGQEIVLG